MSIGLSIVTGIALAAGVVVAGGAATTAAYTLISFGRAKSSALTGGIANPVYATGELIGAALLAALALLLPLAALAAIVAVVVFAIRRRRR